MPQPQPYSQNVILYFFDKILVLFTSSTELYPRDIAILCGFVIILLLFLFFIAIKARYVSFRIIVSPNITKVIITFVFLTFFGIPFRFGMRDSGIFILRKLWDFNPVFYDLTPQYTFDPFVFMVYAILVYAVIVGLYHVSGPSTRTTSKILN